MGSLDTSPEELTVLVTGFGVCVSRPRPVQSRPAPRPVSVPWQSYLPASRIPPIPTYQHLLGIIKVNDHGVALVKITDYASLPMSSHSLSRNSTPRTPPGKSLPRCQTTCHRSGRRMSPRARARPPPPRPIRRRNGTWCPCPGSGSSCIPSRSA